MATFSIISLIVGLITAATSIGLGIHQNQSNVRSVQNTNASNLEAVRETNSSNVEQANLAYERSLPINQVKNLMDAGLSKEGALSKLTGGGSYSAPVLQASRSDAPLQDFGSIASALESLNGIPSNVTQNEIIARQRDMLDTDIQIKKDAARREAEKWQFDKWKLAYDKDSAVMLDNASSKVANALLDSGKTIEDFKDFETLLRELKLSNDVDIRNLHHVARQQLEDGIRTKFANERERREQLNRNTASDDSHRLSESRLALDNINLKYADREKQAQLDAVLRGIESTIASTHKTVKELHGVALDNILKEAGIKDEVEAKKLAAYAKKLASIDEAHLINQRNVNDKNLLGQVTQLRLILRDVGELFTHIKL